MDPVRELEFLQRLSREAAQTLDADALVRLVIAETTGAMGVDVCSVYLAEPRGDAVLLTATNGLSQAGVGHVRLRLGEGITGWVAKERKPAVVADVRSDRRFRWLPGIDQARFVSMCSVPILSGDRLVGVLNVQTDETHHFSLGEVDFLGAIAAQVAGVLERSAMHDRLEAQLGALRRSEEIHRRFTELSLEGAGLDAICAEIALRAGREVALYDDDGERLAPPPGDDDLPEVLAITGSAAAAEEPDIRVLPVRAGAIALGWLALPDRDDGDAARDRAVEHGVTVIALELSRERAAAEAEQRLRGNLVEELLSTSLSETDVARLTERAARLGVRIRRNAWIAVLEPDDEPSARAAGDPNTMRRLLRAVGDAAGRRHPGTVVVERTGTLVAVVPEPAAAGHLERTAELMIAAARRVVPDGAFSCGVSGASGGPAMLHRLSEQARLALRVGRRQRTRNRVCAYRRLGVERIVAAAGSDGDLAAFVDEWLGPLLRQEAQGRAAAPLIDTIAALTDVSWSLRAAARRLNVHVNTLLYRLQRTRELTGRDLDDPDVRLALALALRARTMVVEMPVAATSPTRTAARAAE